jgi:hypothetical protein
MLGTGKGALIWKAWREGFLKSYKQECAVIPEDSGWAIRLTVGKIGITKEIMERAKAELQEHIKNLTESDFQRAVGACEGFLLNDMPTLPIVLAADGSSGNITQSQDFMQAYYRWRTGEVWNPIPIMDSISKLNFETVKIRLASIVQSARIELY